jgi:hypothetical protein
VNAARTWIRFISIGVVTPLCCSPSLLSLGSLSAGVGVALIGAVPTRRAAGFSAVVRRAGGTAPSLSSALHAAGDVARVDTQNHTVPWDWGGDVVAGISIVGLNA